LGVIALVVFLDFPNPRWEVYGLDVDTKLIRSLPYFFVGVIFGQLYRNWKPPERLVSGAFVSVILIIPLLYPRIFYALTGYQHRMWRDGGILVVVSLVFFSVVFLVPDENRILANPIGDFVGKISYSLYLLNLPVLRLVVKLMPANLYSTIYALVFLIAAGIVAVVSYVVVENPARNAIRAIGARG
jgi:peptidoglycan/LPS O-acetylase OafA/YrhL